MESNGINLLCDDLVLKLGRKLNSDSERARFAQFVDRMDCVETWTIDNALSEPMSDKSTAEIYSSVCDVINSQKKWVCQSFAEVVDLIAYFSTSKAITLIEFLGNADPDFSQRVVELVSKPDSHLSVEQLTLKKRLIAIHRADLLNVVFSKKRIELINQVLVKIQNEPEC